MLRTAVVTFVLASAAAFPGGLVFAQGAAGAVGFPSKSIMIVVPASPGGAIDLVARLSAQKMTELWGKSVVIENKAGATGAIGTEFVARSTPDGHTLALVASSHAINPSLFKKLPYDTIRDFAPITLVGSQPYMLIVHPSVPAKSVAELVKLAKSSPGRIAFSHTGVGSATHLAGALLESTAGVEFLSVPYKSPAHFTAVIAGEVSFTITSVYLSWPQVQAGKLRALAVTSRQRSAAAPTVPTMIEAGVPGYDMGNWYGLLMPAATSPAIVNFINARTSEVLKRADTRALLAKAEIDATDSSPQEFARFIAAETAKFAALIKQTGIKPE